MKTSSIGIILSIISSLFSAFGFVLQKKAFNIENKKENKSCFIFGCPCGNFFWLLGLICLSLLSWPLDAVSYVFTSQSIIAALAAVTIFFNQVFAHFFLKEKIGKQGILGSILIITGVTLTIISGDRTEQNFSLQNFEDFFKKLPFIIYFCLILFSILICYILFVKLKKKSFSFIFLSQICGALGGVQNMFLKISLTLFAESFEKNGIEYYNSYLTYLSIIFMIVLALIQYYFINQGQSVFDASIFIASYNCFYITNSSVLGAIYFNEFGNTNLKIFVPSIFISICGILCLVCGNEHKEEKKEEKKEIII